MLRFGGLLNSKNVEDPKFEIVECFPQPFFSKISPSKRIKKWAAYLDKYLLFPKRIKNKLQSLSKPVDLIHIIDHSNSVYLPQLEKIFHAKKIKTHGGSIRVYAARKGKFKKDDSVRKILNDEKKYFHRKS